VASAAAITRDDVDAVRAQFPALGRRHRGANVAYFDGPGGTQVPQRVTDAMTDYLLHHNANTAWAYPTSIETDEMIAASRAAFGDFLNASASEVVFGANMTTLTFHVARALGRGWGPGDRIVVTELDHHANVGPWRVLERERGVTIDVVKLDTGTGELDLADLERAIAAGPRLVAITAASNALGTMPDVAAAAAAARRAGALVFVDAVHYAPHTLVDVGALGCDLLACSAYKFYGPHIGVLWGRAALLESLDVAKIEPAPDTAPDRLETGTQNHEGIAGAHAAVEFLASIGYGDTRRERLRTAFDAIHARSSALFTALWDGLGGIRGVTRFGPPPDRPRTPTVSVSVRDRSPHDVAAALAERGLFLSHGDYYATTVAERYGRAEGFLRIGLSVYSTASEVDRVLRALAEAAA
jgi:cysteine desulfurase family protein (TIGR01976 family)